MKRIFIISILFWTSISLFAQTWSSIAGPYQPGYQDSFSRVLHRPWPAVSTGAANPNANIPYWVVNGSPVGAPPGNSTLKMMKGNSVTPTSFSEVDAVHHPTDNTGFIGVDSRMASDGIINVVYEKGSNRAVVYQTFDTSNDTWGTPTTLATASGTINQRYLGRIAVAEDSNKNLHVIYGDNNQAFQYINNVGGSWSAPVAVAADNGAMHPSVAIDASGVFSVAWVEDSTGTSNPGDYFFRQRAANGTWGSIETVYNSAGYAADHADQSPSLVLDLTGKPVILYHKNDNTTNIPVVVRRDSANTFTNLNLPTPPGVVGASGTHTWNIGIDWIGNIYACGHEGPSSFRTQCNTWDAASSTWTGFYFAMNDGVPRDGSASFRADPLWEIPQTYLDLAESDENTGTPDTAGDWYVRGTITTAPAPVIFFTDLDSGPNTGNTDTSFAFSNGNGAYVTIYGNFFGSTQGTSTITWNGQNCLNVLPSTGAYTGWGMAHNWYQEIVVQIGSSCTPGTGQFTVTVNGQASTCADIASSPGGCNFTVRSIGSNHIYFAETGGNDSAAGAWTTPLLTIRGCKNKVAAGDICYAGGGLYQHDIDSFSAVIDVEKGGSAGLPMAVGSYPGATPQPKIGCTTAGDGAACSFNNIQYGIRIPNVGTPNYSYWTWFGILIHIESGSTALQINGNSEYWRQIGNIYECPNFSDVQGCTQTNMYATGFGHEMYFGNEIRNTGNNYCCKQSHSTYFSSDTSHVWVAWNYWHDNTTCHDLQFHSSPSGTAPGDDQWDLHVYNNKSFNNGCDFLNFATVDPSKGTVEAFNNVSWHEGVQSPADASFGGPATCFEDAGILNAGTAPTGTIQWYNNTTYNCGANTVQSSNGNYSGFLNTNQGAGTAYSISLNNNVELAVTGERYIGGSGWQNNFSGSKNDWFGLGAAPSQFTSNLNVDPSYVSAVATTAADFHLQSGSPLIGAGLASWTGGAAPIYDIDGRGRPSPPSIGAYEFAAGPVQANAPATGSVTLTSTFSGGKETIAITTSSLPNATHNVAYSTTLAVAGGSGTPTISYTWSVVYGALPTGISLGSSTGTISGTTSQIGVFGIVVQATDTTGHSGKKSLALTVN